MLPSTNYCLIKAVFHNTLHYVFFSFIVQWLFLKALQTPTILYPVKGLDFGIYMLMGSYANAIKSKIINIKHALVFIRTFKNSTELLKSFFVNIFAQKSDISLYCSILPTRALGARQKRERHTWSLTIPVHFPHPLKGLTCQIPYSLGTENSQMPGVCSGGMLKFRIDRRIT